MIDDGNSTDKDLKIIVNPERPAVEREAAVGSLLERSINHFIGIARSEMARHRVVRSVVDESDVALEALESFFRGALKNKFPKIRDREAYRNLLRCIIKRTVLKLLEKEQAEKRGGPRKPKPGKDVAPEHTPTSQREDGGLKHSPGWKPKDVDLEHLPAGQPTVEHLVAVEETIRDLLRALPTYKDRQILLMKLAGYTLEQIAEQIESTKRTVQNHVNSIRMTCERMLS